MLDSDTKRRIDACRDILVGKLPDPKSQVEQITLALMYKFMNDMDHEAVDLGEKRLFFAKEHEQYAWDSIIDQRLPGVERIKLYADGIEAVNKNPRVPELFREIFKNAFLPYRDPETFNLFAKEISGFRYEHSEDLGDAFEYLLSIMSSQGDAGQFRTPRHIIDFMVEVVAPRLGEKVLDPACGTAGFLIAAYKHMKKAAGKLTPRKLEQLHGSIEGYDISPDMVRLSRVNLYLHQFAEPAVFEYDTLSDEARWGEKADVIMANPPFMTPKGGIRPHRRFAIQAKRSEVLFVDYILEHLASDGRAAVIVPEGIIFQSANAYTSLRKMLLEGYLWAVASLPAGIFNPYSGVKTSVLFIDRALARKDGSVLFVKVAADGFDLGAQRRANGEGDLPSALELLKTTHDRLASGEIPADYHGRIADASPIDHLAVPRALLFAESDHSLSMERYRPKEARGKQKWPMVRLGDVCSLEYGLTASAKDVGDARFIRITDITSEGELNPVNSKFIQLTQEARASLLSKGDILVARTGATFGKSILFDEDYVAVFASFLIRIRALSSQLLPEYIHRFLQTKKYWDQANSLVTGGGQPQFNGNALKNIIFPLPPLSVQEEIVAEIGRYQAVIDGARAVIDNWRPSFTIDPEWPVVKLGEVILEKPRNGYSGNPVDHETQLKVLSLSATTQGFLKKECFKYLDESLPKDFYARCRKGDVYLQRGNTRELVGMPAIFDIDDEGYIFPDLMIRVRPNTDKLDTQFLHSYLMTDSSRAYVTSCASGAAGSMPKINQSIVENIPVPLPPLSIQKHIVSRIESERELVKSNEKLIELMKARIEETIARVWE